MSSVTRFGQILPLWLISKIFGILKWGLFSIGQTSDPKFEIFYAIGQIFSVETGEIMSELSSHLVTLTMRRKALFVAKKRAVFLDLS